MTSRDGSDRGRSRSQHRKFYDVQCDYCGAPERVPFKPTPGRPVVCRACLEAGRKDELTGGSSSSGKPSSQRREGGGASGRRSSGRDSNRGSRRDSNRGSSRRDSGRGSSRNSGRQRGRGRHDGRGRGDSSHRTWKADCSHCGKTAEVPFKPYPNSVVLCATCMENPNVERVGNRIAHKILCSACGAEDSVPFKPNPDSRVLCRDCHEKEKKARRKARRKLKGQHPAEKHGTQVRIDIRCDRCGTEETLPYLPRTDGPLLCTSCAEKTFGEQWAVRHKVEEDLEYPFTCTRCSRRDFVPFKPDPEKELLCFRCLNDHEIPNPDGKDDAEKLSPYLYRRPGRSKKDE